jgi:hypothetical protein
MHYPNLSVKRPAELAGEIIDNKYALQLIRGFKEKFPGEASVTLIESKTIFECVKGLSNVSGSDLCTEWNPLMIQHQKLSC